MRKSKIDKTIYCVEIQSLDSKSEIKGTLKELLIYFCNTLFVGAKNNKKIAIEPKNINSLVLNVNLGYRETKDKYFKSIKLKGQKWDN